jgi:hypothetical protein
MLDQFWLWSTQADLLNAYESIKAFSETDQTEDLRKFDVPTLVLHGGRRSDRSRQRLGEEIREADQRLAGNLLSGCATRHNRNPRRVGEFALARVFAARSADSAKGSVNLGRGGRSYDTQQSATRHNTSQNDG